MTKLITAFRNLVNVSKKPSYRASRLTVVKRQFLDDNLVLHFKTDTFITTAYYKHSEPHTMGGWCHSQITSLQHRH